MITNDHGAIIICICLCLWLPQLSAFYGRNVHFAAFVKFVDFHFQFSSGIKKAPLFPANVTRRPPVLESPFRQHLVIAMPPF